MMSSTRKTVLDANNFNIGLKKYHGELKKLNPLDFAKLPEEQRNQKLRELNRYLMNDNFMSVISQMLDTNEDLNKVKPPRVNTLKSKLLRNVSYLIYVLQSHTINGKTIDIHSQFTSMFRQFEKGLLNSREQFAFFELEKSICTFANLYLNQVKSIDNLDFLEKTKPISKQLEDLGFSIKGKIDADILSDINSYITGEDICQRYLNFCNKYEDRLKKEIDKILDAPKFLNSSYLRDSLDSENDFEFISFTNSLSFTTDNKKQFLFCEKTNVLFYSNGTKLEEIKLKNISNFHQLLKSIRTQKSAENTASQRAFKLNADEVYTLITSNTKVSHKLKTTINKYNVMRPLKKHLTSIDTVTGISTPADKKIESFHNELDEQRKKLIAHRSSTTLKWLGVIAASIAGLGVLSYWTGKAAYNRFFTTSAEKLLIKPIEKIRKNKYKQGI